MKLTWTASYRDAAKENVWRWTAAKPAREATGWYRLASGELRKCKYNLVAWCEQTRCAWYESVLPISGNMVMVEWGA